MSYKIIGFREEIAKSYSQWYVDLSRNRVLLSSYYGSTEQSMKLKLNRIITDRPEIIRLIEI